MTATKKETEIVPVEKYTVMQHDPEKLPELIRENAGAAGFSEFDACRIRIPPGGGKMWDVPSLTGDADNRAHIEGIIIGFRDGRVYWETSYEESGQSGPPDCYSDDLVNGHGKPAEAAKGLCANCEFSKFGSADKGAGQACRQVRLLFILPSDSILPYIIVLPPTSLQNARKYSFALSARALNVSAVITKVGLEQTKNAGGISYSKATFAMSRELSKDEADKLKKIGAALMESFSRRTVADMTEQPPSEG